MQCYYCSNNVDDTYYYDVAHRHNTHDPGGYHRICLRCYNDMELHYAIKHGYMCGKLNDNDFEFLGVKYPIAHIWRGTRCNWGRPSEVTFFRFIGPDNAVWAGSENHGWSNLVIAKRTKIKLGDISK